MNHHRVIIAIITALIVTLDVLTGLLGSKSTRRNAWRRLRDGKPKENALNIVRAFMTGLKDRPNTTEL